MPKFLILATPADPYPVPDRVVFKAVRKVSSGPLFQSSSFHRMSHRGLTWPKKQYTTRDKTSSRAHSGTQFQLVPFSNLTELKSRRESGAAVVFILVKIGEKKQDEMEKKLVVRLLTMEKAW